LELGNSYGCHSSWGQLRKPSQLGLGYGPVVEYPYQADSPRNAPQRAKRVRIAALALSAVLQAKKPLSQTARFTEIRHSASGEHRGAEQVQRDSNVFSVDNRSACGDKVHAHLAVSADGCQTTAVADIATLDYPDFAGGSAKRCRSVFSDETQRSVKVGAARQFV
jgi:hypothetical protein